MNLKYLEELKRIRIEIDDLADAIWSDLKKENNFTNKQDIYDAIFTFLKSMYVFECKN